MADRDRLADLSYRKIDVSYWVDFEIVAALDGLHTPQLPERGERRAAGTATMPCWRPRAASGTGYPSSSSVAIKLTPARSRHQLPLVARRTGSAVASEAPWPG